MNCLKTQRLLGCSKAPLPSSFILRNNKFIEAGRRLWHPSLVQAATTAVEHLKKAESIQKKLFEECCKDKPDCKLCCVYCSDIVKELDKAQAEHDSILRDQEAESAGHDHSHSHDETAKTEKK